MRPIIVPFFISHRGCPHQCVFCNQMRIAGDDGELPDGEAIRARVAAYRGTAGERSVEVAFFGGSFTALSLVDQECLLAPLQPLRERGEVSGIRISTRPDAIDGGNLLWLRGMGVDTVEIGIQSMDDAVLEKAGRGHTAAQVVTACRLVKDEGLTLGAQLMPGLPGDTPATSLASLRRVLDLAPDFLRIYPTLVIAGTRLAEFHRAGEYVPLSLAEAVSLCKKLLHTALVAGVPVVRIGLQSTAELESEGSVVAGPYHPAFRQLVEGELCLDLSRKLTADLPRGSKVTIFCAPSRVADVAGQRRCNVETFRREGIDVASIVPDPDLSPLELRVEAGVICRRGNLLT
ncbi:elongator complex protein 3 [Geobacter sp. AOG1]|uniref:elongator complex protein 3 n=1 Tax=Geobacter sp. AOG1 TaxID=1566346 RepID=UPI001CC4CA6F|nr:radical SAM protein [Geobacter sp. AOG1]GFE58161.1 radical SAM protein [Geobacter sp. AOG1]